MFSYRMMFFTLSFSVLTACGGSSGDNGNTTSTPASSSASSIGTTTPQELSVSEITSDSVTLSWRNVSNADSYRLYRASEPITDIENIHAYSDGEWVADVTAPYTASGLTAYVTYYFVVTSVIDGEESTPSESVNATPVSGSPGPQPTAQEVRMIELINRARFDPEAEVARHDEVSSLNQGLPTDTISPSQKTPLAFNEFLMLAARDHSTWMLETNTFSHTGEDGSTPAQRIVAAGYAAPSISGENISVVGSRQLNPDHAIDTHHAILFESPGHRVNILRESFREIGIGQEVGDFTYENGSGGTFPSAMLTQKYATAGGPIFITGVVYHDQNGDGFYDIGEGMPNVVITIDGTAHSVYDSGIYSIPVSSNATYHLTIAGGDLPEPLEIEVQMMNRNVKLDVVVSEGTPSVVSW